MKKRILSLMLIFCMILTLMPTVAMAAEPDYAIQLKVTADGQKYNETQDTLLVEFQIKTANGKKLANMQSVNAAFDSTVFDIAKMNLSDIYTSELSSSFKTVSSSYTSTLEEWKSGLKLAKNGNFVFFQMQPNREVIEDEFEGLECPGFTTLQSIRLVLREGKSLDNIPLGSIRLINDSEKTALSQSTVAFVGDGTSTFTYGGPSDSLEKPEIVTEGFEFVKPSVKGSVSINGSAIIGSELTVNLSEIDYNGQDEGTIGYQWKADGSEVGTEAAYTVKADDLGKTITVTVTNSNNSGSVTSAPTAAVGKKDYTGSAATAATVDKTATTVTVNNVVTGQEYAITAGSAEPDSGWNTTGEFTGLDADTNYTVYTRVAATNETKASASVTTSVKTDKLTQTITVPSSPVTVTYGKTYELKDVCSTDAEGNALNYSYEGTIPTGTAFDAATGKIDASGATAEGSFTVKVNAAAYGAYEAAAEKAITIQIANKPAATVVSAPAAKTGLTYTGSAQNLIAAGSASGGTMMYKVGSGSYSAAIPQGTNAASYTVYYKVVGDADHSDSA